MYETILVAIDGGSAAERGLAEAIAIAHRFGAVLHVLCVVDARVPDDALTYAPPAQLAEDFRVDTEALVPRAVQRARAQGVTAEGVVRRDPARRVSDLILDEARRTAAGLIVMGTHGRHGLIRLALGSEAEAVLRAATVPVLLVRSPDATAPP